MDQHPLVDPHLLFEKARLHPGMHIADFGCGRTGHIVFPASLAVGDKGIVYAVDILKEVLENVKKRAAESNLYNIHTVWANVEEAGTIAIPPKSLDAVFIVNVLYYNAKPEQILAAAAELLKEKARIIIIDWKHKLATLGPEEKRLLDFYTLTQWAIRSGFVVQEEFEPTAYNKGLVLFKQD